MKKFLLVLMLIINTVLAQNILNDVTHHYANNEGVKIHYVSIGQGPLIIMLHGFPDYWYTWRNQMKELSKSHKVIAMDLRGYNKSDKPVGVENYKMGFLIRDVVSVIKDAGYKKATIIGHDWGGAIAWQVAFYVPQFVEKLIILSTPHPNGLIRELTNNKDQQKNSKYADDFQKEDSAQQLNAEYLISWVKDETAKPNYIEAFNNSSYEAMLNYYKANFPKINKSEKSNNTVIPKTNNIIECPVLAIFGINDKALLPAGWNNTWEWINNNLTLVSVSDAGHFVQQDASEYVTKTITIWLNNN